MARARNIKPGFFVNEDLVEMDFGTRLLFIGLWTIADRRGRLQDRPKKIKMSIFPADNVDVEPMLESLEGAGLVQRYEVDGNQYIQILNFEKHQNPHKNEAESSIPAPDKHGASTVQAPDKKGATHADSHDSHDSGLDTPSPSLRSGEEASPAQPDDPPKQGNGKTPPCPHQDIIELYHEELPELRPIQEWNDTRRKLLQTRWREKSERQDPDYWRRFFRFVRESDFLMGRAQPPPGKSPFTADLEWLIRPQNFAKVIEGKYHG